MAAVMKLSSWQQTAGLRFANDDREQVGDPQALCAECCCCRHFLLTGWWAFLLLVLQSSLTSAAWSTLSVRANDAPGCCGGRGIEETQSTLLRIPAVAERVQIVDSSNRVVAWSSRRVRGDPISALRPAPGKTAKEQLAQVPALGDDDEVLVSARGVEVHGKPYVVLVAAALEVQTETLRTVGLLLLAAAPLLVALVAVAVWVLVGQSLKTVNASVGRSQRSMGGG
jgi:hypothetical protein